MNFRVSLLSFACLACLLQAAVMTIFYEMKVAPEIATLEKSLVVKNLHRGIELIQYQLNELEHLTQLLAELPAVEAATNADMPAIISINDDAIKQKLSRLELNALYVLNQKQEVVYEKLFDLNAEQDYPKQRILTDIWEQKPKFLTSSSLMNIQSGILDSSLGPMLVACAPIPNKDGKQSQGTLIAGILITQNVMHLIQTLTYSDFKLWPLAGASLDQRQKDIIYQLGRAETDYLVERNGALSRGYMVLTDLDNRPNLLVSASFPVDMVSLVKDNFIIAGTIIFGLVILFSLLLFLWIRYTFLIPTTAITQDIHHYHDKWLRHDALHACAEIDRLDAALAQCFHRLQYHHHQMCHNAYRHGLTETQDLLVAELAQTLQPLLAAIEQSQKKLSNLPINDIEKIIAQIKTGLISPENIGQYQEQLQTINESLRRFQRGTRAFLYELHAKTLRNAAVIRARSRDKKTLPIAGS